MRILLGIIAMFAILIIAGNMDKELLSKDINWTSDIYLFVGIIIANIARVCLYL